MAKDYRGDSKNIIVGAASIFIKADGPVDPTGEDQLPRGPFLPGSGAFLQDQSGPGTH